MNEVAWKKFFVENPPPPNLSDIKKQITEFCNYHSRKNNVVALVTSGGTTVPLEHNTVRFVDNFSAGTRGSASSEYFLKAGCAVIFMYRPRSMEPFLRHIPLSDLMESFTTYQNSAGDWCMKVEGEICDKLVPITQFYRNVLANNMLLKIQFTTLSAYIHLLYEASLAMNHLGKNAILYLAAAVSDFYIPHQDMATHKISSDETLSLNLQLVPKILQPLVRYWVSEAFVVSFKLETDNSILVKKAKMALEKYGHKLVIGNELHTRKFQVVFVTEEGEENICLSAEDIKGGKEIEEIIVQKLLQYYQKFKSV